MKRVASITIAVMLAASAAAVAGVAATCSRSGAGLSVPLTVRETSGIDRRGEPVTVGVPVSRSAGITGPEALKLVSPGGVEVPAQFQVTSRWGGAPGDRDLAARWLLVDFEADVGANGEATYTLSDGGGGPGTDLAVTRNDSEALEISTGTAHFAFSKSKFDLFDSVSVGGAGVVAPGGRTGIVAVDPSGRTFASSAGAPREVSLETDGPVRKTVRMRGGLLGEGGELLDCVARVSLFAGSSDARVQLTVRNFSEPEVSEGQPQFWDIGCPGSAVFDDLTVLVDCTSGGALRLGGVTGGEMESGGSLEVYQDSSGGSAWNHYRGKHPRPQSYVTFRGYQVYRDGSLASSGDRPEPWLDVSGWSGGVAASVRDFWQNYPKALRAEGATLEVSLFPREYAGDYSFRPGEQKTHEVTFCFHGPGGESAARQRASAAQDPLVAAATPDYYLSTGALGRLAGLTDDPEFDAYEALNRSTIAGEEANLFKVIEEAGFYSWQDYGDVPIDYEDDGTGQFNQKYNFDLGMALQFMRTGDVRWYRLADAAGRHVADLDLYHHEGEPGIWWDGGYFGHSYHDEENNTNPNRNYGAPHPDLVFGAPGLFIRYYMTGDPVAFESAREISDNVRYRFDNSYGRGNGEGYAEAPDYENGADSPRPFAHGLWVLVDAYRATGDGGYLDTAEWLIENTHRATDLFITNPVGGDRRFVKVFTWDLLEFSLGRYLDLCEEMGRSDDSGAREQLVAMTRQEAYVMWKQDERGNRGVPYAWMRDGTPWGWEDQEVAVNVCNWQLLTADAMAYGAAYGGDADLLEKAREAFKTGSSPNIEYYEPVYTATKEATNSANFGLAYMHARQQPEVPSAGGQFEEWLCLENPGVDAAAVKIQYYTGEGDTTLQELTLPPGTRGTVNVNAIVGSGRDVSARVTSDRPIVAERPMYFNYHGSYAGGHVALGAPGASKLWFFAEGCTRPGFEQWITIENAGGSTGQVTLTYMLQGGENKVQKVSARAGSRTTVDVNGFLGQGYDVSTMVESEVPVVVERPMYFDYHGKWRGGHDVVGATSTSRSWYFGEGTTRSNPADGYYEEWLCLQNPNSLSAWAHVSFLLDGGGVIDRDYDLTPASRSTVDVKGEVGPDRDVSMVVSSDLPLVAERPMYFSTRDGRDGGDVSLGATAPGGSRCFAEGCTRDGFQTWLSLGNPQPAPARVILEYFLGSGRTLTKEITVPATGRSTVDVNLDVGPGQDVSCRVSCDQPLMVERPMYFGYQEKWPGGHVGAGAVAAGTEWNFAEGCTR